MCGGKGTGGDLWYGRLEIRKMEGEEGFGVLVYWCYRVGYFVVFILYMLGCSVV